jgi:serine/threonine-protein kinase
VLYEMLTGEVPFKGDSQVAVAMKHVREELPDVQRKRPQISAALAAVVDTATAKRQEDRYANDAELIADLEDVLAIETARAGSATGEVTSVLRTLPSGTQRRIPFRLRHPVVVALMALAVVAIIGGGAVWLATRAHHGAGHAALPPPKAQQGHLSAIDLCQDCAHGFNPLGNPTDEHPDASLAIDGQPSTFWQTQNYYSGTLNKAGVGLYLDASPGTTANALRVLTGTPGFTATIYARKTPPPLKWPDPGWVAISPSTKVAGNQVFHLSSTSTTYRYFLIWITSLGGHDQLQLNEINLYRYS